MKKTKKIEGQYKSENPEKMDTIFFNMKKENPFSVPEGYFDTLPEIIKERLQKNAASTKDNLYSSRHIPLPIRLVAAAMIILLLSLGTYWIIRSLNNRSLPNDQSVVLTDTVSQNVAILYLDDEMLTNTLAKNLALSETTQTSDSITSEDIIQYLLNEENTEELLTGL
ncbi:MAG: hypothetical protein NT175_00925 [Bacteroidetes bacterium]|nr:hypothetical protein [Bacteroidota bacterium]